ncbi:MAG: peptidase S10 [Chloroflexia bacterium]|nr:peptidase S10 [Chloroflexia bacterium]
MPEDNIKTTKDTADAADKPKPVDTPLPEPVVRQHKVKLGGKTVAYTTTAGQLPIKNDKGETEANLYFTANTLDDPKVGARRPLTFSFNGGPGSASVWLHMGGLAPRRVEMLDDGAMPRPPYKVIDNEFSWIESTDLVFIDPVDTGYSRATSEEFATKAKDTKGDLESVGEFIRLYLSRYQRWTSPLFLAGESYGTYRSAGLTGFLADKGIIFNGIILISSILNMQTARFQVGNDLPYQLFLPTYAATAWYHGKVSTRHKKMDVRTYLDEVEAWTEETYVPALSLGDRLDTSGRAEVLNGLVAYTGLSREYLDLANLRVNIQAFRKELLKSDHLTVGRIDSRYTGKDRSGVSEKPDYDPSLNVIWPPFTTTLNQYFRAELGYENDTEYHILRSLEWTYGDAKDGYSDTSGHLREAMAKNPYMMVYVASGYYDLATPYYATLYTLNHMGLDADAHSRLTLEEFPVGHMVYVEKGALKKLQGDIATFIKRAVEG